MTFKPLLLLLGLACAPAASAAPKSYTLSSPDGELQGSVTVGSDLRISLEADGRTVLAPSPVSMTLAGGETLGHDPRVVRIRKHSADETIESPFYTKARVSDRYNELTISFRGDYSLVLRLYDDGMAYRFVTQKKGTIVVEREQADFTFPEDYTTRAPYVHRLELKDFEWQFSNSFENT